MPRFTNSGLITKTIKIPPEDAKSAEARVGNFSQLMRSLLRMYLRGEIKNIRCEEIKITEF